MPYALFLFIAIPILEIALLLRVGDAFGWVPTLLIVIATAIVGSAMLRHQGLATLYKARQRMDGGELPAQQMLEGVFIMIGGVLLLTPGFVTDTFGFVCLIPPTRQWLSARISSRVVAAGFSTATGPTAGGAWGSANQSGSQPASASTRSGERKQAGDIIDGDFKRIDDD